MPFVYLLRCRDHTLYAGAAKDLAARLARHHAGKASAYTAVRRPVDLVWWIEVETWSEALREEIRVKALSRAAKLLLVGEGPPAEPAPPATSTTSAPSD
jgi:putative endonuclease